MPSIQPVYYRTICDGDGLTLSGFYGAGLVLVGAGAWVEDSGTEEKSGFLFGFIIMNPKTQSTIKIRTTNIIV